MKGTHATECECKYCQSDIPQYELTVYNIYEKMWNELRQYQIDLDKSNTQTLINDNSEFYHFQRGNMMGHKNMGLKMEEIEKKYNIDSTLNK
jgi:hypothetical protein